MLYETEIAQAHQTRLQNRTPVARYRVIPAIQRTSLRSYSPTIGEQARAAFLASLPKPEFKLPKYINGQYQENHEN